MILQDPSIPRPSRIPFEWRGRIDVHDAQACVVKTPYIYGLSGADVYFIWFACEILKGI